MWSTQAISITKKRQRGERKAAVFEQMLGLEISAGLDCGTQIVLGRLVASVWGILGVYDAEVPPPPPFFCCVLRWLLTCSFLLISPFFTSLSLSFSFDDCSNSTLL